MVIISKALGKKAKKMSDINFIFTFLQIKHFPKSYLNTLTNNFQVLKATGPHLLCPF